MLLRQQVVVFTGLLGATPNEDALASVLGHEVGHVVANHAGEKLSKVCCLLLAYICLFVVDVFVAAVVLLLLLLLLFLSVVLFFILYKVRIDDHSNFNRFFRLHYWLPFFILSGLVFVLFGLLLKKKKGKYLLFLCL